MTSSSFVVRRTTSKKILDTKIFICYNMITKLRKRFTDMKMPSAQDYIYNKDFEGAKERFDKTNYVWKQHWYDTCYEIARKEPRWFTFYTFYPKQLMIVEETRTEEMILDEIGNIVYLIRMFNDNGEYVFLKGGKTNNLRRRMRELKGYHYKREHEYISSIEIIKIWKLPTEHLAESFEKLLHDYFCQSLEYFRQDRFTPTFVTEHDFEELEKRYKSICSFV